MPQHLKRPPAHTLGLALWTLSLLGGGLGHGTAQAQAQTGTSTFPMRTQPSIGQSGHQIGPSIFPLPVGPASVQAPAPTPVPVPAAATSAATQVGLSASSAASVPATATAPGRAAARAARRARPGAAPAAAPSGPLQEPLDKAPHAVTREASTPGSAPPQARPLVAPTRVEGSIASRQDTDHYRVDLEPGARLAVTLVSATRGADCDLYAYDNAGQLLAHSSEGAGRPDRITLHNPSADKAMSVFLQVLQFTGSGAEQAGRYSLTLVPR